MKKYIKPSIEEIDLVMETTSILTSSGPQVDNEPLGDDEEYS